METELKTTPAVLRATVQVVRANTGKVETYELIGTPVQDEKEPTNGRDPSNSRP